MSALLELDDVAGGYGETQVLFGVSLAIAPGEVLALLGEGLSNADTGRRIHMSEATVKTYVSRILAKLGCENRVQAALVARDAGLAAPPDGVAGKRSRR